MFIQYVFYRETKGVMTKVLFYSFLLALLTLLVCIAVGVLLYLFESVYTVLAILTGMWILPVYLGVCFVCIDIEQK